VLLQGTFVKHLEKVNLILHFIAYHFAR